MSTKFKHGDVVQINKPTNKTWHGYIARVVRDRSTSLTSIDTRDMTLLTPIKPRPDTVSDSMSEFWWTTADLVKVDDAPAGDPAGLSFTPEELQVVLKLLSEAVQLGIDIAPTAGDYSALGAAWHFMRERKML